MTLAELPDPPQHLIDQTVRVTHVAPASSGSMPWHRDPPCVLTVPMRTAAAPWVREALAEVSELTALAPNWDTYGARPIEAASAARVATFLYDHAYGDLPAPHVVPMTDGGVQLEWHRNDLDFEIAFSEDDAGVYVEDLRTGDVIEEPLSAAASYLIRFRSRLAA